jgi:hypothetical protein
MWDGSVIEKPESEKIEGDCPVISRKATRLQRSRKGVVFAVPHHVFLEEQGCSG